MLEFKKSRVILILAAFLTFSVTTNVWAFNPFQDLQTNPPTGKNYSILPVWYSTADYKTKITVTNTDEDQSVIAFVDIMDGDRELRHFFIYLPPNDSWTGEIRGETPRVYSEDDSIVVDMGNFASEANPVDFPFPTSAAGTSSGYIKVVEVLAPFIGQDADNYAVFFSHFFTQFAFRLHEVPTANDFDAYPNSGILEVCEEIIHVETGETFSHCDDNTRIAPGAPFVTLDVDGTSVNIRWNVEPNADGYRLYYSPNSDLSEANVIDLGFQYNLTGVLPPGTDYYIAVRGYNSTNLGPASDIEHIVIAGDATAPSE